MNPRASINAPDPSSNRQYDTGASPSTRLEYTLALAPFVAVTATRTVNPTSAPDTVYVAADAPAMSLQLLPAESHRRH